MGRCGRLPNGAQDQPGAAFVEKPDHPGKQRPGEVDQGLLVKQRRAYIGDVRQQGNLPGWHDWQGQRLVRLANKGRQADAEDCQGQARGNLVGHKRQSQYAKQQAHQGAGTHPGQDPEVGVAGVVGGGKTGHRTHGHGAFRAEVEHPCLFGDQFAEGDNDQGRACHERGEQDCANQTLFHVKHPPWTGFCARATGS
ncbi:hypothetical protein D3C80_1389650 [compost metagenome]